MASPRKSDDRTVARTYRAAIRIGEDFITLEETIALPIDASDEEVQQAIDLGWRIYRAQREAADAQIADIRSTAATPAPITVRDPDAPASDKQRNYIATLQEQMSWNGEQMATYAEEQSVDLVTMTKGQASVFIDGLKKLADERSTSYTVNTRPSNPTTPRPETPARAPEAPRAADSAPVNEKQLHAMERLAQQHGLDLDAEAHRRFGVLAQGLSYEQASTLLRELQRPIRRGAAEPAL
jgi:hypothetical protein